MTNFLVEKAAAERFKIGLYYLPPDVANGNAIERATVTVTPAGLTLAGDPTIIAQQVMQMIAGGEAGTEYLVQFRIETTDGSILESPNHDAIRVRVI